MPTTSSSTPTTAPGNPTSTAQGAGPQAQIAYNTNGTPKTSTSPGANVSTSYGPYDSQGNLTAIIPASGSSLGTRNYTWENFGRLRTATDGRGNTITYSYDKADRITKVDYSDAATRDVTYSYDAEGHVTTRVDGSGTTTYSYDDLGHLTSVGNTIGGEHDELPLRPGRRPGLGDRRARHRQLPLRRRAPAVLPDLPARRQPGDMLFGYDDAGRRIDTWLQTNATHSTWGGHSHTTYDGSGRVTHVVAHQGPARSSTTVLDQQYCYQAGTTRPVAASPQQQRIVPTSNG
jgi:YD repeat-containing protein